MAASRTQLSVEAGASWKEIVLQTKVDLEELVVEAAAIEISRDCGKFVCERECVRTRGSLLFSVGLLKQQPTHGTLYLCPNKVRLSCTVLKNPPFSPFSRGK